MTETKRVYLVHGWTGSPERDWLPWARAELQKNNFEVVSKQMPTDPPKMKENVAYLRKLVGSCDEETFFVGHSAGCITILRYFETLSGKEKSGGAVLVAGFTDDLGYKELSNFFVNPIDWKKIKSNCRKFVAINSDTDPFVPLKHAKFFEEKLGAKVLIEHDKGHFTNESPEFVTKLESVIAAVLEISK